MGWALLVHRVTGGVTVVPDEPGVIARHEVLDWERRDLPDWLSPDDPLAPQLVTDRGLDWTPPDEPARVNGVKSKPRAKSVAAEDKAELATTKEEGDQ